VATIPQLRDRSLIDLTVPRLSEIGHKACPIALDLCDG